MPVPFRQGAAFHQFISPGTLHLTRPPPPFGPQSSPSFALKGSTWEDAGMVSYGSRKAGEVTSTVKKRGKGPGRDIRED